MLLDRKHLGFALREIMRDQALREIQQEADATFLLVHD